MWAIILLGIFIYCAFYTFKSENDRIDDKMRSQSEGDIIHRDLSGNTYLNSNDHKVTRSYDDNGNLILKDMKTQKVVVNYGLEKLISEQKNELDNIIIARDVYKEDSYLIAEPQTDIRYMFDKKIAGVDYNPNDSRNKVYANTFLYKVFEWENRTCMLNKMEINCEESKLIKYKGSRKNHLAKGHQVFYEIWVDIFTGECKPRTSNIEMYNKLEEKYPWKAEFDIAIVNALARKFQKHYQDYLFNWSDMSSLKELNEKWHEFESCSNVFFNSDSYFELKEKAKTYYSYINKINILKSNIVQAETTIEKLKHDIAEIKKDKVDYYYDGFQIYTFSNNAVKNELIQDKESYIENVKLSIVKLKKELDNKLEPINEIIKTINNL